MTSYDIKRAGDWSTEHDVIFRSAGRLCDWSGASPAGDVTVKSRRLGRGPPQLVDLPTNESMTS